MSAPRANNARTIAGPPRSTAIAALGCATVLIAGFVFIAAVWPLFGIKNAADVADADKILPAVANYPILMIFNALDVPVSVLLLLVARGLRAQIPPGVRAGLAQAAVLVAGACFFALGVLRLVGYAQLASLYGRDPAGATSAYATMYAVQDTIDGVAIFAVGCWLAVTNWLGLKAHHLPVPLAAVGLLAGTCAVAASAVHAAQPVALVLMLTWFAWLGVELLRAGGSVADAKPVAVPA